MDWSAVNWVKVVETSAGSVIAAALALVGALVALGGVLSSNRAAREREAVARRVSESIRRDDLRREAYVGFLEAYQRWADIAPFTDDDMSEPEAEAWRTFYAAAMRLRLSTRDPRVLAAVEECQKAVFADEDPRFWSKRATAMTHFIEAVELETSEAWSEAERGPSGRRRGQTVISDS